MNTQQIAAMAKSDPAVINLAVGEIDFATPSPILEAVEKALTEEQTRRYAPIYGFRELRELATQDFQRDGLRTTPENTVVGPGAKPLLAAALFAICRPGDKVLIPKPYYPSYLTACRVLGLKPKIINGLSTVDDFKKAKALVLNHPNNPTGMIWNFKRLHLPVPENVWVVADEAYREIVFDRQHQWTSIGAVHKKTITIRSLSKGHNMAGWRVGYLTTPHKSVLRRVGKYLGSVVGCTCSISQKAAIAALKNGVELSSGQIDNLRQRKDFVVNFFREQGIPVTDPAGGLYVWIDITQFGLSSCEMANYLLKTAKVAVSPGKDYGDDSHIRICFSAVSNDILREAIENIATALRNLSLPRR